MVSKITLFKILNFLRQNEWLLILEKLYPEGELQEDSEGNSYGGVRMTTFMIYLSDVESGGHTIFTQAGISVKPKLGMYHNSFLFFKKKVFEKYYDPDWVRGKRVLDPKRVLGPFKISSTLFPPLQEPFRLSSTLFPPSQKCSKLSSTLFPPLMESLILKYKTP